MQFENHQYYNCEITTSDGNTYKISANWMHNSNIDNFQNWQCGAGQLRINIDRNLEVWSGECHNDHLGHALNGFTLLDLPTTCRRPRCTGCTDDLTVAKQKP